MIMQIQELAHIFIPTPYMKDEIFDISGYAQGMKHLKITIQAGCSIILHDTGTHKLESLELIIEKSAQAFLISQRPYKFISIKCYEESYFSCAQVLTSPMIHQVEQKFVLAMQEDGARACVRIMPLLQSDQFECLTEQLHMSSNTSSDVQVVGSIYGAGHFGNKSKISVPAGLQCINIVQKTIMFLVHAQAKAYALPCFDVASKDIKCSHGAALGSMDANQLWYLQTRGICKQDALILIPRTYCLANLDPIMPLQAQKLISVLTASK